MAEQLNDHDGKMQEPWQELGRLRDDLRQLRALLASAAVIFAVTNDWFNRDDLEGTIRNVDRSREIINRALSRIGDGSEGMP